MALEQIPIKLIDPNPHRNFSLYPLDEEQVARLVDSYGSSDGDFGTLPARRKGSRYQIAAGHHRLEAMRRLGFRTVDLKVAKRDDDAMLRIMIKENSSQQTDNAASTMDAVAAVVKHLTYEELIATQVGSQFNKVGRPFTSQGIGLLPVWNYFENQAKGQYRKHVIEGTLATLKQSEEYITLMREVVERVQDEFDEGTPAYERAEKFWQNLTHEEEPEPEPDEDIMDDDAEEEVKKVKPRKQKKLKVFNAKCANVFRRQEHLDAFRKSVTHPDVLAVLPVERQYDLAETIVNHFNEKDEELTGRGIRAFISDQAAQFYGLLKKQDKEAKAKALAASLQQQLEASKAQIIKGFMQASRGLDDYKKVLKKLSRDEIPKDTKFVVNLRSFIKKFSELESALASYVDGE